MGGKRRERRQAIVAVATDLFCTHGYSHTTMSMIASRLGGSKATLWAHFRSKEELFAASLEKISEQGEELGPLLENTEGDIVTVLQRFGCAYLRFAASDEAMMVRRAVIGGHLPSQNEGVLFLEAPRRMLGDYLSLKYAALHDSFNHDVVARTFLALLDSTYLEAVMFGFLPECDEANAVRHSVDVFIRAYGLVNR